ncbi:MAG: hypothetical protein ACE5MI_12510 [Acidimicrobiia bacterium]
MRPRDGNEVEMSKEKFARDLDQVLRGKPASGESGLADVESFVARVRSTYSGPMPAGTEAGHVAAASEIASSSQMPPSSDGPQRRPLRSLIPRPVTGAVAPTLVAAVVLALVVTTGAAYAGALPRPIQDATADLAGSLGLAIAPSDEVDAMTDAAEDLTEAADVLAADVTDYVDCQLEGNDSCLPPDTSDVVNSAHVLVEAAGALREWASEYSTFGECIAARVAELEPELAQGSISDLSLDSLLDECGPLPPPIDELNDFPDDFHIPELDQLDIPELDDLDREAVRDFTQAVRDTAMCIRDRAAGRDAVEDLAALIADCELPDPADYGLDFELPKLPGIFDDS